MAYTPINWQTGDTITAEKLNKMDNGWNVDSTQLFSETVTTADDGDGNHALLAYIDAIDAGTIIVMFDGTEYTCSRIDFDGFYYYGGFIGGGRDFAAYPFCIVSGSGGGSDIYTETAGTHTVTVAAPFLQTSADFDKARGYGYVSGSPTELFSETVTTVDEDGLYMAQLAYSDTINADSLTVTFDGTEYTCTRIDNFGFYYYGGFNNGPDFTEYPFCIETGGIENVNTVFTETAGTHTIAVTAAITSMQTSADFQAAAQAAAQSIVDDAMLALEQTMPLRCISNQTPYFEMNTAQNNGRLMYFQHQRKTYFVHNVSSNISGSSKIAEFFPANDSITVGFDNNVFTVTASA